jgi:hypothetical protein
MFSQKFNIGALLISGLLPACRERPNLSDIKADHQSAFDISMIVKPRYSPYAIEPRKRSISPWKEEWRNQAPKSITYLKKLLSVLSDANPEVFKGWYQANHLYFGINDEAFYLDANSEYGFISVSPVALLKFSPEELLGVLAHEIAHILQRDQEHFRTHPGLEGHKTYALEYQNLHRDHFQYRAVLDKYDWDFLASLKRSSKGFSKELFEYYDALSWATWLKYFEAAKYAGLEPEPINEVTPIGNTSFDQFLKLLQQDANVDTKNLADLYKSPHVPAELSSIFRRIDEISKEAANALGFMSEEAYERNFMEERADTIGFLLFRRAGYSASQYTSIFKQRLGERLAQCKKEILTGRIPARRNEDDKGMYPSLCYRVYNIERVQANRLQGLQAIPTTDLIDSQSLEEVRNEIRQLQAHR